MAPHNSTLRRLTLPAAMPGDPCNPNSSLAHAPGCCQGVVAGLDWCRVEHHFDNLLCKFPDPRVGHVALERVWFTTPVNKFPEKGMGKAGTWVQVCGKSGGGGQYRAAEDGATVVCWSPL